MFASGVPTWRLPTDGSVANLVTWYLVVMKFNWVGGPGGGGQRVRLNRKTPAHLEGRGLMGSQSRPQVWKFIRDHLEVARADAKRRRLCQRR